MGLALLAVVVGLALLVWSADRFVDGAASTAWHFKLPALLIGMVIVGLGTSAPEIVVSVFASFQGNPGIALGNAYGSNITNIALILGLTAVISPIIISSQVLRQELPILTLVTLVAAWQVSDSAISRVDAVVLLMLFGILLGWIIWLGLSNKSDTLGSELEENLNFRVMPLRKALIWLVVGLLLLVVSSRILVWGAVGIARGLGISDLMIGLTVVAIGTSLPELASSIAAVRKGEHDIAIGNVIGSNLFNTLAVVGIAGLIMPVSLEREVYTRDMLVMTGLTVSLFVIGYGFRGVGRINRIEGALLVLCYFSYIGYLIFSTAVTGK